jgi:hypothetical protein
MYAVSHDPGAVERAESLVATPGAESVCPAMVLLDPPTADNKDRGSRSTHSARVQKLTFRKTLSAVAPR